ncbi:MAG: hypothetical protein KGJ89_05435 [Patescibacteria group bacterium]|nr:hypothetical protein [Patescibacteria group bacterium]MDE2227364.1 hypothetical protein [Patescibacteria group bacterium]
MTEEKELEIKQEPKTEKISIVFYDSEEKEIGRKTYNCGYGKALSNARKRAKKIGATFWYHVHYLRRFEEEDETDTRTKNNN